MFIINLRKKSMVTIFFIFCIEIFARTRYNGNDKFYIMYNTLSPIKINVSASEKMTVKSGTQKFRYSESVPTKSPIELSIRLPYFNKNGIVDSLYGTITLELLNNGNFLMTDINSKETIQGRGVLLTTAGEKNREVIKLRDTGDRMYEGSIKLDVIFNEENKLMKLGEYKGVMIINANYGD